MLRNIFNRNGIFLLDKPINISSNFALQKVKRIFKAKKAGHTGSLDPLASGMLPICFGEATKFSRFLLEADKIYLVKAKLGIRTTTSDSEGDIINVKNVDEYNILALDSFMSHFIGETLQIPSMYSALKHNGQPLYKLARQGIVIERKARKINVHYIKILNYENFTVSFEIKCSKGTYIRTIVDDFGELLGCGAHVIYLRRLSVGNFKIDKMYSIDYILSNDSQLNDNIAKFILPLSGETLNLKVVILDIAQEISIKNGNIINYVDNIDDHAIVALHNENNNFIGVAAVLEKSFLKPLRLISL